MALWIEGTSVRLTAPLRIEGVGVVDLIEGTSMRLIEHVVIQGSAGVDRAHQHEADRGSLLIERVVILGSAAVDRRHQHEADRARRHPAGRRPVWIEGTGMRLTAPVWIEAPA